MPSNGEDIVTVREYITQDVGDPTVKRYVGEARQALAALNRLAAAFHERGQALQYVDDCFNAALIEGWIDAMAEGDMERIRDIWQRRISYAWSNTLNALQPLPSAPAPEQTGE